MTTVDQALKLAEQIGDPIMVKMNDRIGGVKMQLCNFFLTFNLSERLLC